MVENFLNIGRKIQSNQIIFNAKKGFYCFRKREKRTPKCLGKTKGRKQITIPAHIKSKLALKFKIFNKKFFLQINRKFLLWA